MPKNRQRKETDIEALTAGIKSAQSTVFANFQGLKVSQAEDLRRKCRQENVSVIATKKTLLHRVLQSLGLNDVDPGTFQGGVAVFTGKDEVSTAKIVATFAKTHEVVTIYGGILEGKSVDASSVIQLAKLPSKQELLAKVVGSLNAPVSGFVRVLSGNLRGFLYALQAIKDQKIS